jgi:hypothetical protein
MQRILALVVLLVIGTGCTRPKQFSKCITDADRIVSEVQEHRRVFGSSGQFGTPLGHRATSELLDRDQEMISCIASDPANRANYREALDLDDTVKSDRFLQYLLDRKLMQDFGQWEQQQQTVAVGHN